MSNRDSALMYVQKRINAGYTVEMSERESRFGMSVPEEPGFEIRQGRLFVPWNGAEGFSFLELAVELKTGISQLDLFS